MWLLFLLFSSVYTSTVVNLNGCQNPIVQTFKLCRDNNTLLELQTPVYAQSAILCSGSGSYNFDKLSNGADWVIYVGLDPQNSFSFDYSVQEYSNIDTVFRYYQLKLKNLPVNITFFGNGKYTLPSIFSPAITYVSSPSSTSAIIGTVIISLVLVPIFYAITLN